MMTCQCQLGARGGAQEEAPQLVRARRGERRREGTGVWGGEREEGEGGGSFGGTFPPFSHYRMCMYESLPNALCVCLRACCERRFGWPRGAIPALLRAELGGFGRRGAAVSGSELQQPGNLGRQAALVPFPALGKASGWCSGGNNSGGRRFLWCSGREHGVRCGFGVWRSGVGRGAGPEHGRRRRVQPAWVGEHGPQHGWR
jgi:hypothetical protein